MIIIEDGGLPHQNVLITTAVVTVALSVIAHGLTAAPLADRYADWYQSHPRDELPALENRHTTHVPWRRSLSCTPRSTAEPLPCRGYGEVVERSMRRSRNPPR